jgi:large subunit ribosomal protein L15
MNLQDVKSAGTALKKGRRVGRGPGSGRGCTAGKGNKGQGSRSGTGGGLGHEGGQMPLYRRLPKRGFTNAMFRQTYTIVNVGDLARAFPKGGDIDLDAVKTALLVKKNAAQLKVLGDGEVGVAFKVRCHRVSASARAKIEAAGGSVETIGATAGAKDGTAA